MRMRRIGPTIVVIPRARSAALTERHGMDRSGWMMLTAGATLATGVVASVRWRSSTARATAEPHKAWQNRMAALGILAMAALFGSMALGRVQGPWVEVTAWALTGLASALLVTTSVLHVRTTRRLRPRGGGPT